MSDKKRVRLIATESMSIVPVLNHENFDEFCHLSSAVEAQLQPNGIIEKTYTAEFVTLAWEIHRYHRCKRILIEKAIEDELYHQLQIACTESNGHFDAEKYAPVADLAQRWFSDEGVRLEINEVLDIKLSISDIEAAAVANSLGQTEEFNKLIYALECRRDLKWRRIAEYRETFARQLEKVVNQVLAADNNVPRLEHATAKKSSA